MKLISFYLGVGFDKNDKPITPERRECALAEIRNMLAMEYGGYTEMQGTGAYWPPGSWMGAGLVTEPSYVFTTVTNTAGAYGSIAYKMATAMNQTSVLVTVQELSEAAFVNVEDHEHAFAK